MGVESAEYNDHDLQSVASEVCGLYACYFVAHGLPELKPHTVELSDPNKNQQQPKTSTTTTYHQEESRCLTNKTSLLLMFFVQPNIPTIRPVRSRSTPVGPGDLGDSAPIFPRRFGPSDLPTPPSLQLLPRPKLIHVPHPRFQLFAFEKRVSQAHYPLWRELCNGLY